MQVFYALCCLGFAALNDFVFKLFARRERPRGLYVLLSGCVWVLLLSLAPNSPESVWHSTIVWGIISGVFSVTSNLLLIESMTHLPAGISSTVFRLNLVPVALWAWILLGESPDISQITGVIAAVFAVIAFVPPANDSGSRAKLEKIGFIMALAASLLRAGMGLSYKYAFLAGADRNGILLINGLCWVVGGIFYSLFFERKKFRFSRPVIGYGMLTGGLLAGIVFFMALSLQNGEASVVLPIAQMSFLGTFLLSWLLLKEKITPRKLAGAAFGVAAILLLSLS